MQYATHQRTNSEGSSSLILQDITPYIDISPPISPTIRKRNFLSTSDLSPPPIILGEMTKHGDSRKHGKLFTKKCSLQIGNNTTNGQHGSIDNDVTEIHQHKSKPKLPVYSELMSNTTQTSDNYDKEGKDTYEHAARESDNRDGSSGEWGSQLTYVSVCLCITLGSTHVLEFALVCCQIGGGK